MRLQRGWYPAIGALGSALLVGCGPSGVGPAPTPTPSFAPVPSASASAVPAVPPTASPAAPQAVAPGPHASLSVLPGDFDFSANPDVVHRIAETPHRYFRFINPSFVDVVCERYAGAPEGRPEVGLHGDPHVEQYAVTDIGRGLTDLDDASIGPPAVDLLRMGTSLLLALREKASQPGFEGHEGDALAALFRGYHRGIAEPGARLAESDLDRRLHKKFERERKTFLAFTNKTALPFSSPADESEATELYAEWASAMGKARGPESKHSTLRDSFFGLKHIGIVQIGIGSGLDRRFLLRVEGRTASDDDDVVFEIKRERSLPAVTCARPSRDYTPTRFLFTEPSPGHFDPVLIPGKPYWVGEWLSNYRDVKIDKSITAYADLEAIALESGFLLGRGHVRSLSPTGRETGPRTQGAAKSALLLGPDDEKRLGEACTVLAGETVAAWKRFHDAAEGH